MKEPGWLRMEKIDTDYKQRNWKIEAKFFKSFNGEVTPLKEAMFVWSPLWDCDP